MNSTHKQRGQILILLVGSMFLGGGAATTLAYLHGQTPKEMMKAVKKVVKDDAHKDAIVTDIDLWGAWLKTQDKDVSELREKLLELLERHDATRPEADQVVAKLDDSFREMDRRFLDMGFRVKERVSKAEWESLSARLNEE